MHKTRTQMKNTMQGSYHGNPYPKENQQTKKLYHSSYLENSSYNELQFINLTLSFTSLLVIHHNQYIYIYEKQH